MGLLIGKGGKNIKELERLSDCRLRTMASQECEDMTELHISSSSSKAEQQEKVAADCLRAARLVCEEGKTIEQGWQIAREERQLKEQRAAKLLEACRLQMAARKLRLVCPEMSIEEACAALHQSQFDEDLALDLFYQGAIAVERVGSEIERPISEDNVRPAHKEEFPMLNLSSSVGSSAVSSAGVSEAAEWCKKQVTKTRSLHGSMRNTLNAEDVEAFPSLPISKAATYAKAASKVPPATSRKCIAKEAANRQCPSLRAKTCAVAEVPRWQRRVRS